MHRLEPAPKDSPRSATKAGVHKAGSSGAGSSFSSLAAPGPSWSNSSLTAGPAASPDSSRRSRIINVHQKLRELYLQECRNGPLSTDFPPPLRQLKRGSRLLQKLVERENLNTLIINLYPGNKGYSLCLRLQGKIPAATSTQAGRSQGTELIPESMNYLYSDEELLRYIDREELPSALVDIIEATHSELFYQGCVIAEVRDSRLTFPLDHVETHYVLLRPTTQSIINDVNMLGAAHDLSAEERLSLESQIVQATAPPLCLDPNPAVGIFMNNMQAKKHRFSTAPIRRTARKFSQVSVNRKRKLDQFTAHDSLHIYDFIARKRAKANIGKQSKKFSEGILPPPPPVPSDESLNLPRPTTTPDVFEYAKAFEAPKETVDCSTGLVEEFILETERGTLNKFLVRLAIHQRYATSEYSGELYVDRDFKEGEVNGRSCRFVLGNRAQANKYIQQFTEIFTEEGRKSVRITHLIPGQTNRVSYTQGPRQPQVAHSSPLQKPAPINNTQQIALAASPAHKATTSNSPAVSQLTSLLKNAAVPPNVNVHQIQQQQAQATPALTNSAIQSILSNALSSGVLGDGTIPNGPVQPTQPQVGIVTNQINNATVHYQPTQAQTTAQPSFSSKPSRQALSSDEQINAIANSLMISAQQHEQKTPQIQAQAAVSPVTAPAVPANTQNPTIIGLLNAATPLTNQKLVARKANLNLQSQRLLDQNFNAVLSNNVSNPTLVVNNNQLRVTLSSFPNQLVSQAGQTSGAQHGSFAIVTTQGNITIGGQGAQNQTYPLANLAPSTGQTLTLTANSGGSQGFTISPAQNSQTYTVVQPNQNFGLPSVQGQTFQINPAGVAGQTIAIATSVPNQFNSQQQNTFTVNQSNQIFAVNIPTAAAASSSKGVSNQSGSKSFTIQANNQTFAKVDASRASVARSGAQRRLSNAFQQASQTSELNKLLSDRGDSRLLTERHIADKVDRDNARLCQVMTDAKTLVSDSKLSQALTADASSASSLGLSMPGLSALLAGTPSADNPMPGTSNSSSLLDRLTTPSAATFTSPPPAPSPGQTLSFPNATFASSPNHVFNSANTSSPLPNLTSPTLPKFASPSPKSQVQFQATSPSPKDSHGITSPLSSPPGATPVNLNLHGVNLQDLALQVSMAGLAVPISLNVSGHSGAQGVLMTSLPVATTTNSTITTSAATMVLTNSSNTGGILSLPVAQLMGSSSKGNNSRSQATASISIPQSTSQSLQLVSALRANSRSSSNQGAKNVQPIAARGAVAEQRQGVKMATGVAPAAQLQISNTTGSQMVALSPQQLLQLQKHGFQSLVSTACVNSPSAIANKHRRRSNAADPNK